MNQTKEQLEQAYEGIRPQKSRYGGDIMRKVGDKLEKVYTVSQSDVDVIKSLIQDALDPWNYNMDEAPRDGTEILVSNSKGEMQVVFYEVEYEWMRKYEWKVGKGLYFNKPTAWQHLPKITEKGERMR